MTPIPPSPLRLGLSADLASVDHARALLSGFCAACFGAGSEAAADMLLAATEAMNNIVEHGRAGTIRLEATCGREGMRLLLASDGVSFDPAAAAALVSADDLSGRDEGGYGLYLMRQLVDRLEYEYRGMTNLLVLHKLHTGGDDGIQDRDGH